MGVTAICNEYKIASAEASCKKHNNEESDACVVLWSFDRVETTLKQYVDLTCHQPDDEAASA